MNTRLPMYLVLPVQGALLVQIMGVIFWNDKDDIIVE